MKDLAPRTFGVLEPLVERCQKWSDDQNSICLVPGLAFDRHGFRLGYGKGYYDRFLSQMGGYIGSRFMLAFEMQRVKEIDAEACDIRVNRILTDRR